MRWKIADTQINAENLSEKNNISPITATVLLNRGINNTQQIGRYLNTSSKNFSDVYDIADFEKAISILEKSINNNDKIFIYGDYDVDGVMATTILYKGIKELGADVQYYMPHRMYDGYGLNAAAVNSIHENGCQLLITCDNGIASLDEIALAKELGITVIILDHHEPITENNVQKLPIADAVVDCKRNDSSFAFRDMCAGGLCYRFIKSYYLHINKPFKIERELVTFAGIATVCDVVSLVEDNRIIVKLALYLLNNDVKNIGLRYLLSMSMQKDAKISTYSIGFIIGPCINAVGRLETAAEAVELFTTDDDETAKSLATRLVQKNKERKEITQNAADNLEKSVDLSLPVQVLYAPDIHESVAGIIASRIKDKFYRPTLVITKAKDGCKGSGRSIEEYNLHKNMSLFSHFFTKFGGHALATGFSLPYENIEPLRKALNNACTLNVENMIPAVTLDCHIPISAINLDLANEISLLAPYGKGNEKPHFFTLNTTLQSIRFVGSEKNIAQLIFSDLANNNVKGIYFNGAEHIKQILIEKGKSEYIPLLEKGNLLKTNIKVDIAYSIEINSFNNTESVQLNLDDIR